MTKIDDAIKSSTLMNPITAMKDLYSEKADILSQDDQKFLIDYRYTDPKDIRNLNGKKMLEKNPNASTSGRIQTMFPLLIFALIGISAVIFLRFFNPFRLLGL